LKITKVLALSALAIGLTVSPTTAQNGTNYRVFSNGFDAIYGGIGAGGTSVPGVDGIGVNLNGEDLRGNTLTVLGDFGYREAGWRESLCVLGAPTGSTALDFPVLVTIEFDGVGAMDPSSVFTFPACLGSSFPLGNSGGFVPLGGPSAGALVLLGLPSGAGFPSSTTILAPNEGLVGTGTTGTATLIAAAGASLPIASTGFCWVVQFGWSPSALASLDDIDSWYTWRSNGSGGALGSQYWGMSNDELGTWQSQTLASGGGLAGAFGFGANLNYEYYTQSVSPTTHDAIAPTGFNGAGTYYTAGAGVPNSGSSLNGGFDVGFHQGMSLNGTGGVPNANTGVANQDPAGSPTAGLIPTVGFFSYNNSPGASATRFRLTWLSIYNELSFGLDPAANGDATLSFGTARTPNSISQLGGPFPTPTTLSFFPFFIHSTSDQSALGNLWTDPSGFPGGTFGVQPNLGASIHLPTLGVTGTCVGLPLGLQYGSSALGSASGPLAWSRSTSDAPSNSGVLSLID